MEPAEPLENLPAGMARYRGDYRPVDRTAPAPRPTNVGGYDELIQYFRTRNIALPRSKEGLGAIDGLIDGLIDGEGLGALNGLAVPIGMFYGDVLTHGISGAHWEMDEGTRPRVRITPSTAVEVVLVAERRLVGSFPSLVQNHAHVLEIVDMVE